MLQPQLLPGETIAGRLVGARPSCDPLMFTGFHGPGSWKGDLGEGSKGQVAENPAFVYQPSESSVLGNQVLLDMKRGCKDAIHLFHNECPQPTAVITN